MHRIGIESALAEQRPVIMSVPAGPLVHSQTPMLQPALTRRVPLGQVPGVLEWRARTRVSLPLVRMAE